MLRVYQVYDEIQNILALEFLKASEHSKFYFLPGLMKNSLLKDFYDFILNYYVSVLL